MAEAPPACVLAYAGFTVQSAPPAKKKKKEFNASRRLSFYLALHKSNERRATVTRAHLTPPLNQRQQRQAP
jgi:hypothetical protein